MCADRTLEVGQVCCETDFALDQPEVRCGHAEKRVNLCILSLFCRLFLLLRETGEKCIFLPNMQALVAIYILGKLLPYGPRPQIFFNQGIGRDICVATKWGRIHGYARAPK